MRFLSVVVILVFCICAHGRQDDITTAKLAESILNSKAYPKVSNETTALQFAKLLQKHYPHYLQSLKEAPHKPLNLKNVFPCTLTGRSNPRPTKATELLPGDIDVVAAIGDSLVAAFGALSTNIFGVFNDYRGVSFADGAEFNFEERVTVPAILRLYNPNLKGWATGTGDAGSANAALNVAVSGARSYNLLDQIKMLEEKMANLGVSPSDWKLISVFVGGNDLCDYCTDKNKNSPQNYSANVELALDTIQAKFPNVFVNLVSPPDVTLLGQVSYGLCSVLHYFECSCANDASTTQAQKDYTEALYRVVSLPKYRSKEGFHVSLQPFCQNLLLPKDGKGEPDRTYFAPDCFHFSGKAHEAAATALWNNMCESGTKLTSWVPGEPLECPDKLYLS